MRIRSAALLKVVRLVLPAQLVCLVALFVVVPGASGISGASPIRTVPGTDPHGDGGPATEAQLRYPTVVAVDGQGNLYIADADNHRVREVSGGVIRTIAGTGIRGFSGDGGLATAAELSYPAGVAVDGQGNLYIADSSRVREVSGGVIRTVAGNGVYGFSGDGGPATAAELEPNDLAVDGQGNLYIVETYGQRVREVSGGVIRTVAGTGVEGFSGDGGPATAAELSYPAGVAVDGQGTLYIADSGNDRVREVSGGVIGTAAGADTRLSYPTGVTVDRQGNLYIADSGNDRVREVSGGVITTVAGNGVGGFSGDGGPATAAQLRSPHGLAVDGGGDLFVADSSNDRVREVSGGVIRTVAGGSDPDAQPLDPHGVAVDGQGNLYIADYGNNRVQEVSDGVIRTVAGTGAFGFFRDAGPATAAQLDGPEGVAVDGRGNLYIADSTNNRVLKVSGGRFRTIAGTGDSGFSGDGGPAAGAELLVPTGVAVDRQGNVYIADFGNDRVREVSGGVISTVAGTGGSGFSGDGGSATAAQLDGPEGVAVDGQGNLYIADTFNRRVREVSGGVIRTVAGDGIEGFSGDGGPATAAQLEDPEGVAVDGQENVYVADSDGNRVQEVSGGVITTVAGTGASGFSGDGGPAAAAQLDGPEGVGVDGQGNLYIADTHNHRVREVVQTSSFSLALGGATVQHLTAREGIVITARCSSPCVVDAAATITIAAARPPLRLQPRNAKLATAGPTTLTLRLPPTEQSKLRVFLKPGRRAQARVTVRAVDVIGNQSVASRTITIRL